MHPFNLIGAIFVQTLLSAQGCLPLVPGRASSHVSPCLLSTDVFLERYGQKLISKSMWIQFGLGPWRKGFHPFFPHAISPS